MSDVATYVCSLIVHVPHFGARPPSKTRDRGVIFRGVISIIIIISLIGPQ